MDYRITATLRGHGRDEDLGGHVLERLLAVVPELGPVVGQDLDRDELDVTVAIEAHDAEEATAAALPRVKAALRAAGADGPVIGVHVEPANREPITV
jgi:hypothetical protein